MPRTRMVSALVLLACATVTDHPRTQVPAPAVAPQAAVSGKVRESWQVDPGREGDFKIETFLGRPARWLKNNTHVRRLGLLLTDGTIELDVAPLAAADFVGITFRRERWLASATVTMSQCS